MNKPLLACLILAALAPVGAQSPSSDRISELERKVNALSREMETLKLAPSGAGHALSKVSLGGYGEMTYQNFSKRRQDGDSAGTRDQADFLRAVLYAGYKFSDRILFNSEIEFEHGTTGNGRGEVSLEQAHLDFRFKDPFSLRAGLLLVPMGITNEKHEPTFFHGVRRPSVEQRIIPSTWRENGFGFFGRSGIFSYRSYLMTGLQAISNSGVSGFTGSSALRSGRSSGAKSFAEDLAWVARLDASPVEGATLGASFYQGEADQGLAVHSIAVSLWEMHAQAEYRGLELKTLYAQGRIGNADTVNSLQGFTDAAKTSVGRSFFGGYGEAAFNVLSLAETTHSLAPFFRYERYDTQQETPNGFSKNPANSRVEYVLGLTYKPLPQVAIKADHQWNRNQARTGVNQFNLGLGYVF